MTGPDSGKRPGGAPPDPGRTGVSGGEMAGACIQFAVVLVAFSFAGMWLDRQLGTSPWFVIVMVFLGAAGGFFSMYHKLMKGQRLGERRKHAERRDEVE
jgi:F0F1-type ATP synthase assembly protein I